MPSPYLHPLEVGAIAAREERRLAHERGAWGAVIRWGMEEAGWRAALSEQERVPYPLMTLGEVRLRLTDPEEPNATALEAWPSAPDSAP